MATGEMGISTIEADTTTIGDGHTISTYLASAAAGFLTSTTVGSDEALDVYLSGLSKTEDTAHGDGTEGLQIFAVRQDTLATLVSATGDLSMLSVDSDGALYVNVNSSSVEGVADTANLQQIVTVGTSAVQLPASNLANRKLLMVQNVSNKKIYLGSATVTADETATGGVQLGRGGFVTLEAGPSNDVYGRAGTASNAVAVWEFS